MKMTAKFEEMRHGSIWLIALRTSLLFIVICGIAYPLASTGLAQLIFPDQANGSMVKDGSGRTVGSELIGQTFTDPSYFQGRISSIDNNGAASGSNNYSPSNPELLKRVKESIAQWEKENPKVPISELPIDLITNSGSGLDPDITPASAEAQIPRISALRHIPGEQLQQLVKKSIEGRDLGVFGEKRVNVLKLNLALKELAGE
ncbi:potassium-transporting ATPase subunit KdpC [Paenibacillus sp.]|jgi:K+-transporting ATPase ATPase C chain|uniref:potassium-transporting ATPase subunit KdpC n=1 Tax=Paenibacillus sp. TaxID=58172 RepID=UPI002830344A|nr:potassium-transporting ATPase subunit KdpC [Paenibacillus sp.]MDR0269865.1 potassium-transporting ATPase subunit KdpC [Paenibacillus sp.]